MALFPSAIVRFAFSTLVAGLVAGCGSFGAIDIAMPGMQLAAAPPAPHGHVYIFRGIGGKMANLDLDELGDKINRSGVDATVHGFTEWRGPAEEAIRRYQQEPQPSPIVLIGHSAGGDSALSFASRLKEKQVPVALVVTFDPTRAAGEVPGNVQRYVNIYQSTNVFGGGDVKPAADFRGHFSTMNLKSYWNVLHVNMLKIDGLKDRVVDKVAQVTALAPPLEGPKVPIQYVMPRELPIEIFDSGVPVTVVQGETMDLLSERYSAPTWAIAQLNNISEKAPLRPGQRLVIPRHLETIPPMSSFTNMAPKLGPND